MPSHGIALPINRSSTDIDNGSCRRQSYPARGFRDLRAPALSCSFQNSPTFLNISELVGTIASCAVFIRAVLRQALLPRGNDRQRRAILAGRMLHRLLGLVQRTIREFQRRRRARDVGLLREPHRRLQMLEIVPEHAADRQLLRHEL